MAALKQPNKEIFHFPWAAAYKNPSLAQWKCVDASARFEEADTCNAGGCGAGVLVDSDLNQLDFKSFRSSVNFNQEDRDLLKKKLHRIVAFRRTTEEFPKS